MCYCHQILLLLHGTSFHLWLIQHISDNDIFMRTFPPHVCQLNFSVAHLQFYRYVALPFGPVYVQFYIKVFLLYQMLFQPLQFPINRHFRQFKFQAGSTLLCICSLHCFNGISLLRGPDCCWRWIEKSGLQVLYLLFFFLLQSSTKYVIYPNYCYSGTHMHSA